METWVYLLEKLTIFISMMIKMLCNEITLPLPATQTLQLPYLVVKEKEENLNGNARDILCTKNATQ